MANLQSCTTVGGRVPYGVTDPDASPMEVLPAVAEDLGDGTCRPLVNPGLAASSIGEYNITLAMADTEYSQALPANCKGLKFWSRSGLPVRFAFTAGKVAAPGPTDVYFTLGAGETFEDKILDLSSKTIYFATDNAGEVVEMMANA